jgi:hypothetical protein
MPATTARKGSAAYEAGIREGRAMSAKARRAPEESEEPENEEEMDMDMGKKPHSRKRSAKNANNTKAPMDGGMYGKKPMDGECGCKGKKGAKCDGSCGGAMRKRGDAALTPHEYLDACDSGIQDRSRSYIRARLDAAERLDLKCGKGSISKGEKCTKGAAQEADPRAAAKQEFRTLMNNPVAANQFNKAKGSTKGVGNKIKAVGEFAARLGGGAAIGAGVVQLYSGAMKGNLGEVSRGYRNMQLGAAATQVAAASKAGRMGKKQLSKEFLKSAARNAAIGVGQEAAIGGVAGFNRSGGMAGLRRRTRGAYQRATGMRSTPSGTGWASSAYDRPLRGRRDSVYASGFPLDSAALAI